MPGPTDQQLGSMTVSELTRLIGREVSRQIVPIPKKLLELADDDSPLLPPPASTDGYTLVYDAAKGQYIDSTLATSTLATDGATPSTPSVTLASGPGWIKASWAASTGTADPLRYKVFLRAGSAPTTSDDTYKVADTPDTNIVLQRDATNGQLSSGTTYHVKVIAYSSLTGGGTSAASTDQSSAIGAVDGTVVTISNLDAGNITAGNIAAARMQTNVLSALQVTATTLSAIVADLGTITAGTITGATIRTAASGARVEMDSTNGIRGIDGSGNVLTQIAASTGKITIKSAAGTGSRVELSASGLIAYNNSNTAVVTIDGSGASITAGLFVGGTFQTADTGTARLVMDGTSLRSLTAGGATIWSIAAATGAFSQGTGSLVTTLSTIAADFGTITAGTVNGATVQTASADPRVIMDSTGVYAKDGQGTQTFKIDATKGTFTGSVYLDSAAGLKLAGGVSQPLTAPGLTATAGGSLAASTTYFVTFAWYDGTHESPFYTTVPSKATTVSNKTIQIVIPAAPSGATYARVYMDTATFKQGAGFLQTLSNADTKVAVSTSATTTISVSSFTNASATSPSSATIAFQGPFGTTATIRPANMTDSTGADYGWSLEGNGRARFLGPTMNVQGWQYDDFFGPDAVYSSPADGAAIVSHHSFVSQKSGTGATCNQTGNSASDPGVIQMTTGTTTTGYAGVRTSNGTFALGVGRFRFSVYVNIPTVPSGTQTFQVFLGFTNTATGGVISGSDHGVGFRLSSNSAAGTWTLVCADNGAGGGGAVVATQNSDQGNITGGTWHFLEFEVDAARSAVNWWHNNVKQTAITTHIPTAVMQVYMIILKSGTGTTARTMQVDFVGTYFDFVTG